MYEPSNGNLTFSRDTVYLDTVFTNIGSSTYTLTVYNKTSEDISIPTIRLKNGSESYYRLNIEGIAGKSFQNIPLYAKDSLFVYIETTIANDTNESSEFIYEDAILFDTEPYLQSVQLITLAKDAIFIYADALTSTSQVILPHASDEGSTENVTTTYPLTTAQLHFTNQKPYVIYGYAEVPEGKQLVIDAGARIYFHSNSGLIVKEGAQLSANGMLSQDQKTLENEIIFEGDRLEPSFENIPRQWGGIYIMDTQLEHNINYCTIKNASVGLYIASKNTITNTTVKLSNCKLYNSGLYNLWTENTSILVQNSVFGGAANSSVKLSNGGSYTFIQCTIANYFAHGPRLGEALAIRNFKSDTEGNDLTNTQFINCIIDGNNQTEIRLASNNKNLFNFSFQNCLITYPENNMAELYNFEDTEKYKTILLNGFPDFYNPSENDFKIGLLSEGIDFGDAMGATLVPFDILGKPRENKPDIGAYQATENE